MAKNRVFSMSFLKLYELYIGKAENKGRTKEEVDAIIKWLFGYNNDDLINLIDKEASFEDFITQAPFPNPDRSLIKGVVCGVRIENIEDPLMREVRYLDKLIDELAKGKTMEKILERSK